MTLNLVELGMKQLNNKLSWLINSNSVVFNWIRIQYWFFLNYDISSDLRCSSPCPMLASIKIVDGLLQFNWQCSFLSWLCIKKTSSNKKCLRFYDTWYLSKCCNLYSHGRCNIFLRSFFLLVWLICLFFNKKWAGVILRCQRICRMGKLLGKHGCHVTMTPK